MKKLLSAFIAITSVSLAGLASLPAQADQTHLNVDHREMVHLRYTGPEGLCNVFDIEGQFRQVRQTGKLANQEYLVPAGKELVITDVKWAAIPRSTNSWSPGFKLSAVLTVLNETGESAGLVTDYLGFVQTESGTRTREGAVVNFTGGYRVASRRAFCGRANEYTSSTTRFATLISMEILGYLVDKKQ